MKNYMSGVVSEQWGYDLDILTENDLICGNVNGGLCKKMDHQFRVLNAEGRTRKAHNVLSEDDDRKLCKPPRTVRNNPKSISV